MSEANFSLEVSRNGETRYSEYEELLLRRDQLYRECGSYMTAYTAEFGEMLTANFELKVECIKKKKAISYCRRRINRDLPIDPVKMQAEIDEEMTLYYEQLKEMSEDTDNAKKAGFLSEFQLSRAKKIYRRLTKILHPDINQKTEENETLRELWDRVAAAYLRTDVEALEDLEVLVRKAMDELGDESYELNLNDIEERMERVEKEINEILTTEPYLYKELLNSEEKKLAFREQLQAEHEDFERYLESLSRTLNELLAEGGATLRWVMN